MNPEEEANYRKSILFKIGIIVIIVIIFSLWLANLQNVFEINSNKGDDVLKRVRENIDQSLKEAETNFTKSASSTESDFVNGLVDKVSSTATSTKSTSTVVIEIKKELTDLIKKEIATTTATSSPKRISCPEYINCMPTIGEQKPCVVPVGCEKITQIAY
jgi:hypothetical protein